MKNKGNYFYLISTMDAFATGLFVRRSGVEFDSLCDLNMFKLHLHRWMVFSPHFLSHRQGLLPDIVHYEPLKQTSSSPSYVLKTRGTGCNFTHLEICIRLTNTCLGMHAIQIKNYMIEVIVMMNDE